MKESLYIYQEDTIPGTKEPFLAESFIEKGSENQIKALNNLQKSDNFTAGILSSLVVVIISYNIKSVIDKISLMFSDLFYSNPTHLINLNRILRLLSITVMPLLALLVWHYSKLTDSFLTPFDKPFFYLFLYLAIVAIFLLRKGIFYLIGYTVDNKEIFKKIEEIGFITVTLFAIAYLLPLPFQYIISDMSALVIDYYLIIVSFLIFALYTGLVIRQIIKEQFYLFFGFLYLCTLELLPVMLLVKALYNITG